MIGVLAGAFRPSVILDRIRDGYLPQRCSVPHNGLLLRVRELLITTTTEYSIHTIPLKLLLLLRSCCVHPEIGGDIKKEKNAIDVSQEGRSPVVHPIPSFDPSRMRYHLPAILTIADKREAQNPKKHGYEIAMDDKVCLVHE